MVHSFLLIGQSNMAGRGFPAPTAAPRSHSGVLADFFYKVFEEKPCPDDALRSELEKL